MDTKQKKRPPSRSSNSKPTTRKTAASRPVTTRKTVKKEEPKISAEVVYLPPKPFNRSRLVLRLITVVAVVLAVFFSLTIYFKVGEVEKLPNVEVIGEQKYTEAEIIAASGIKTGDNLIFLGKTKTAGKIISALPYIKSVRIGIKLPDKVKILVEEVEVTYAIQDRDASWWLISAEGKVIDQAQNGQESRYPKILGVQLESPTVGQQAAAWQDPDATNDNVPLTVTAAERLTAVVNIAGFLEQNMIIGKMASIDVDNLMDIKLWYGNQYQILLGNTEQLGVKIASMKAALAQVSYDEGILDIRDPNNILIREFK